MYLRDFLDVAPRATSATAFSSSPPPPIPEYSDESNGPTLLIVSSVFTSIAVLVVMARTYVRTFMLYGMGWDDYTMIFAVLCSTALLASLIVQVNWGIGSHITNPRLQANLEHIRQVSFFQGVITVVGISVAKISVGFFLLRLAPREWYRRTLYGWILFLILYTFGSAASIIFRCMPIAASWNSALMTAPRTKCLGIELFKNLGLISGSMNIFTDFVFAILPIPIIMPLQMNKHTKLALLAILSLGYFACAASVMKSISLSRFFGNPESFFDLSFAIWNDVELNVGILAASLPALRPLFNSMSKAASSVAAFVRPKQLHSPHKQEMGFRTNPGTVQLNTNTKSSSNLSDHGSNMAMPSRGEEKVYSERYDPRISKDPRSRIGRPITDAQSDEEVISTITRLLNLEDSSNTSLPQGAEHQGTVKATEVHFTKNGFF